MKYACEVVIDKPRNEVIKLFDNTDNLKYWQKGFISFNHVSGEPGKQGAESIIKYDFGKRKIDMIETITFNNLPDEIHSNYTTKGVVNIQRNFFKEEADKTRWISEAEFRFQGLMKIIAFFMGKKPFKKQTQSYMDDFKAFVEGNPRYGQD